MEREHISSLSAFCGLPDEDTMSEENGLSDNLLYVDARWLGEESWRFEEMWKHEEELVEFDGDSDSRQEHFQDDEYYCLGFDEFVGSTIIALARIGAVPFASCNGGDGHYESHPLVAFWCDEDQLSLIENVSRTVGVKLSGFPGQQPHLLVWVDSDVQHLRRFARALVDLFESNSRNRQ